MSGFGHLPKYLSVLLTGLLKGKILAQDPQDQVLSTKGIYLPQREREQGIRDKDRRQRVREKRKGTRDKGKGH